MNLSRTQKIILGIFSIVPFLMVPYIIYEVFHFVMHTVSISQQGDPDPADIIAGVLSFIGPVILCSLISLMLLIFYIIHAVMNKTITTAERVIWVLVFIFVGSLTFPVYWLMRVWNEGK
ncbi:MAG TPA: hypothetical protein VGK59_14720 [Ohtaekwangia sp.]